MSAADEMWETKRLLHDALVPLDVIRERFGISKPTLTRWLAADSIETHPIAGSDGRRRAVRWGDILEASRDTTRWTSARM